MFKALDDLDRKFTVWISSCDKMDRIGATFLALAVDQDATWQVGFVSAEDLLGRALSKSERYPGLVL